MIQYLCNYVSVSTHGLGGEGPKMFEELVLLGLRCVLFAGIVAVLLWWFGS